MAEAKIYAVVKNGGELGFYKSLPAAKKLADKAGGQVVLNGQVVYQAGVAMADQPEYNKALSEEKAAPAEEKTAALLEEKAATAEEETSSPLEEKPDGIDVYILKHLMNVRKDPSLKATILTTMGPGTEVVAEKVGEWLKLKAGGYILYDGGKYATLKEA